MHSSSYVVVTWPETGPPIRLPRHRAAGRHRHGTPGTVRRHTVRRHTGPARRRFGRGRHRQVERPSVLAARYGTLVVLLGVVTVSGWFAANGAAAFAQMVQP